MDIYGNVLHETTTNMNHNRKTLICKTVKLVCTTACLLVIAAICAVVSRKSRFSAAGAGSSGTRKEAG